MLDRLNSEVPMGHPGGKFIQQPRKHIGAKWRLFFRFTEEELRFNEGTCYLPKVTLLAASKEGAERLPSPRE